MHIRQLLLAAASAAALGLLAPGTASAANCSDAPDLLEEIQQKGVIRIGWINSKPYQFRNEKGELEGVLVNAAKKLTDELLKVKAEWVEAKWDTFIAGLQAGKYDIVISNVARRPNRATSVWFTKPWIIGYQSFLVRKDTDIKSLVDMDQPGNTVVVRLGSAAHITYTPRTTRTSSKRPRQSRWHRRPCPSRRSRAAARSPGVQA